MRVSGAENDLEEIQGILKGESYGAVKGKKKGKKKKSGTLRRRKRKK